MGNFQQRKDSESFPRWCLNTGIMLSSTSFRTRGVRPNVLYFLEKIPHKKVIIDLTKIKCISQPVTDVVDWNTIDDKINDVSRSRVF